MSLKPISELRRRMLKDMAVRRLSEKTKSNYIHHIENFTAFLGRSPNTATAEDVRRFQVHLTETGVWPSSINQAATAMQFFFDTTVDRPELARHLAACTIPANCRGYSHPRRRFVYSAFATQRGNDRD